MWYWHLISPDYDAYLDRARQQRAEALAGATYRAIDRLAGLLTRIGTAVAAAARSATDAARRRWRRRATLRTLGALDDRTLKDIGLRRAELPWVVEDLLRSPARGDAPAPAATAPALAVTAEIRLDTAA